MLPSVDISVTQYMYVFWLHVNTVHLSSYQTFNRGGLTDLSCFDLKTISAHIHVSDVTEGSNSVDRSRDQLSCSSARHLTRCPLNSMMTSIYQLTASQDHGEEGEDDVREKEDRESFWNLFLIPHSMFNASGWALVGVIPSQPDSFKPSALSLSLSGLRSFALTTASTHMPRRIVLCSAALMFSCSSVGQTWRWRAGHPRIFIALFLLCFTTGTNSWCHQGGILSVG